MLEYCQLAKFLDVSKRTVFKRRSELLSGEVFSPTFLKDFFSFPHNFPLAFNTDGIQTFKSSKFSMWQIFSTVNELDVTEKSRFLSLNSVLFGLKKTNMKIFLKPFINEAIDIF